MPLQHRVPVVPIVHVDQEHAGPVRILGLSFHPEGTGEKRVSKARNQAFHFLRARRRSDFSLNSGAAFEGNHLANRLIKA